MSYVVEKMNNEKWYDNMNMTFIPNVICETNEEKYVYKK